MSESTAEQKRRYPGRRLTAGLLLVAVVSFTLQAQDATPLKLWYDTPSRGVWKTPCPSETAGSARWFSATFPTKPFNSTNTPSGAEVPIATTIPKRWLRFRISDG